MAILDHLVPALAPVYGEADPLASLPLGVWLKAPFIPFMMNEKGRATTQILIVIAPGNKQNQRASRPDDFRYRVLESNGRRLVEVAQVDHGSENPTLRVGYRAGDADNYRSMLPQVQHKALAATASVDPQRWKYNKTYTSFYNEWIVSPLFDRFGLVGLFLPPIAAGALGIYGVYKLSQVANRALQRPTPKRGT